MVLCGAGFLQFHRPQVLTNNSLMTRFMNGVVVAGKPKKRSRSSNPVAAPPVSAPLAMTPSSLDLPGAAGGVTDAELHAAINIFSRISRRDFHAPRFRELRTVIFPLLATNVGSNVARVSEALSDGRWDDAIAILQQMQLAGERPKLGAAQRWVRDCDATGDDDTQVLRALDAVMRTAFPEQISSVTLVQPTTGGANKTKSIVTRHRPWIGFPSAPSTSPSIDHVLAQPFAKNQLAALASKFKIIACEAGPQRNPPNVHSVNIHAAKAPHVLSLVPKALRGIKVERIDVPHVQGAFLLKDMLSQDECIEILTATEAIGYQPDEPITSKPSKSVLAHNVVWIADDSILQPLLERCLEFLPPALGKGSSLVGINGRFRCYRYDPGDVYRPHVDGAWPMSGVDEAGKYVYDISNGKVLSRLTFLVYLNEGFEGGCTTFFTPDKHVGQLNAFAVVPRVGSVLVFPHGEGSIVHEGSAVTRGRKYVIRTEVLYTRDGVEI